MREWIYFKMAAVEKNLKNFLVSSLVRAPHVITALNTFNAQAICIHCWEHRSGFSQPTDDYTAKLKGFIIS